MVMVDYEWLSFVSDV